MGRGVFGRLFDDSRLEVICRWVESTVPYSDGEIARHRERESEREVGLEGNDVRK